MADDTYKCDPDLHNGKSVLANYFIRDMDDENSWDSNAWACCEKHLAHAMAKMVGTGDSLMLRVSHIR